MQTAVHHRKRPVLLLIGMNAGPAVPSSGGFSVQKDCHAHYCHICAVLPSTGLVHDTFHLEIDTLLILQRSDGEGNADSRWLPNLAYRDSL